MSMLTKVFTPKQELLAHAAILGSVLVGGLLIGTSFTSGSVKAAQKESDQWKAHAVEMEKEAQHHREHGDALQATLERFERENQQFAHAISEIQKSIAAKVPKPETPTELASSLVSRGLATGLAIKPVQFSTVAEADSGRLWEWSESHRLRPMLEEEVRVWEKKDANSSMRISTLTLQASEYKAWGDGMSRSNDSMGKALAAQKDATDRALAEVRAEKRKKWLLILGGAAAAYVARGH